MNRIQQYEEISMNAWPALQTIYYDGWILRFSEGVTKRSNSVNPLYGSTLDIEAKIDYCEKLYRSKRLPVCFKITEMAHPAGIDKLLDLRGYKRIFGIALQTMNIRNCTADIDQYVHIAEKTDGGWLEDYCRMNEIKPSNRPEIKKIIDLILLPNCLLTYKVDGQTVGCGLGVVEGKYIGLYDIVIDKQYRNKGFGKIMVENILKWGRSNGAESAYLQVLVENTPAVMLYEKIGFKEEYQYWYRVKN